MGYRRTSDLGGALRGSSGAIIVSAGERLVRKVGDPRVAAQGKYLRKLGGSHVPNVARVYHNGYDMEMLSDPSPLFSMSAEYLVDGYLEALQNGIWGEPRVEIDHAEHLRKLTTITTAPDVAVEDDYDTMLSVYSDMIDWSSLSAIRTHGDPTFDNLMWRGSELVIIDPIPPTPAVPDLLVVDLGKIMQSLVGFECVRYGGKAPRDTERARLMFKNRYDENTWSAVVYWCAFHLYRAVPYMPSRDLAMGIRDLARWVHRDLL